MFSAYLAFHRECLALYLRDSMPWRTSQDSAYPVRKMTLRYMVLYREKKAITRSGPIEDSSCFTWCVACKDWMLCRCFLFERRSTSIGDLLFIVASVLVGWNLSTGLLEPPLKLYQVESSNVLYQFWTQKALKKRVFLSPVTCHLITHQPPSFFKFLLITIDIIIYLILHYILHTAYYCHNNPVLSLVWNTHYSNQWWTL
jgi:hypothetical protein